MNTFALVSALHHEHKQRTGHDVTRGTERDRLRAVSCDVCMWLRRLWEDEEAKCYQREREHMEDEQAHEEIRAGILGAVSEEA